MGILATKEVCALLRTKHLTLYKLVKSVDFGSIIRLLAIILVFSSVGHLNAFLDRGNQPVDVVAYGDIKKECYHFIYGIHRNLNIWEWSDSVVKHMLKTNLEDYLTKYLNTPESRKLHLKYEAMDWDIHAMMEMHLSGDE